MTFQKGHPSYLTEESIRRISEKKRGHPCYKSKERNEKISRALTGKKHKPESIEKMRLAKLGTKHTESWKKLMSKKMTGYVNPKRVEIGLKISLALKGKKRINYSGSKHHAWKGGISPINAKIRKSIEYREWRQAVFIRDKFTCVLCGEIGGRLHADHIKPFSLFPELRFDLGNGRTLCKECHLGTPTYGHKVNNYQMI